MTIIQVACAGVEHIGRVEGNSWKKAKKRQMLLLHDAVKVIYAQDDRGNVSMSLMDMKKRQLSPGGAVETKYEGTVYLQLSTEYPYYIWPLKTDGDLYRIYKNALSDIILPGKKIVTPPGVVTPMHPHKMGPRRKH